MIKIITLLVGSLLLVGCSQFETARNYDIQPGQFFVLIQPIEIQSGEARRFIQHGELTKREAFDRRFQHCRIEVRSLKESAQTIQPERFEITKVGFNNEPIAQSQPLHFASVGFSFGINLSLNNDGPSEQMELVEFYFQSGIQPDVMRLVCASALSDGSPRDYPHNQRPNAKQIAQILGKIGHFE